MVFFFHSFPEWHTREYAGRQNYDDLSNTEKHLLLVCGYKLCDIYAKQRQTAHKQARESS